MSFSVEGKVAIVTGSANGIGLAIARNFLEAGAKVMFADIDEQSLIDELGASQPDDSPIRYFAGDLREKLTIANLLSATLDAFDRVDILVNAARQCRQSDLFDPSDESIPLMLEQNFYAAMRISKAVTKRMIKQGQDSDATCIGTIVNLSSSVAQLTRPELLAYSVSYAALNQMTRSMALSLAPERIRVNAVAFGSVMSASLQNYLKEHAHQTEAITAQTPLGRIASPREVAQTVQFLASDSSSFMTGQILNVDGGRGLLDAVNVPAH